jgi:hypothetical protein
MRKSHVLMSISALIAFVIGLTGAAELTSRAWAVAPAVGDRGGYEASRLVLTVKDDKDHIDKCTLCQVCIKNPDGPDRGMVSCFANWWSKSGCKAKLNFAKSEGTAKGLKISGHCQCERKACSCEGTPCL